MWRKRTGFTLIELLVVIAIIAILAAILFPVFAQAKVAAKGAASISNNKQILTANMIYMSDYDDKAVIVGNMSDLDAPYLLLGTPYKPWSYLLVPYMKSTALFQDPLWSNEPGTVDQPDQQIWAYRTQFGYAYMALSPVTPNCPIGWNIETVSNSALAQPADTIMVIQKKARNNNPDWLWQCGGGPSSPLWMANIVPSPLCNLGTVTDPSTYCPPVRWGVGGWPGYEPPTFEEGRVTGGVAFRKNKFSIVGMADGHTKAMSPSRVAGGTNWTPTRAAGSIVMTDSKAYLWDNK